MDTRICTGVRRRCPPAWLHRGVPSTGLGGRWVWPANVAMVNVAGSFAPAYPLGYNTFMIEIRETEIYANWFAKLRDRQARARIDVRIRRLSLGNPGDVRAVGEGVSELRIDYGPGYRVYFVQRGLELVILLAGGDKRTQDRDIQVALELARHV